MREQTVRSTGIARGPDRGSAATALLSVGLAVLSLDPLRLLVQSIVGRPLDPWKAYATESATVLGWLLVSCSALVVGAAARSIAQRRGARLAAGGLTLVAVSTSFDLVAQLLFQHPDARTPHWLTVAGRSTTAAGAVGWTVVVVAISIAGSGTPARRARGAAIAAALANAAASLMTVALVWSPTLDHAGRWTTVVVLSLAGLSWALFAVVPISPTRSTARAPVPAGAALACLGFVGVAVGTVLVPLVLEQWVSSVQVLQAAFAARGAGWFAVALGCTLLSRPSITPVARDDGEGAPALAPA